MSTNALQKFRSLLVAGAAKFKLECLNFQNPGSKGSCVAIAGSSFNSCGNHTDRGTEALYLHYLYCPQIVQVSWALGDLQQSDSPSRQTSVCRLTHC